MYLLLHCGCCRWLGVDIRPCWSRPPCAALTCTLLATSVTRLRPTCAPKLPLLRRRSSASSPALHRLADTFPIPGKLYSCFGSYLDPYQPTTTSLFDLHTLGQCLPFSAAAPLLHRAFSRASHSVVHIRSIRLRTRSTHTLISYLLVFHLIERRVVGRAT